MAKKRSMAQWQMLIQQQKSSGSSIADFCQQHGLTKSIFYKYKKAQCGTSALAVDDNPFIKVNKHSAPKLPSSDSFCLLQFHQCYLTLPSAVEPTWVAQLIKALS